MPDLLKSKTITARKTHHCMVCGSPAVQPGQTYTRYTYVDAGTVFDHVQCGPCDSLMVDICDCEGWGFEDEGLSTDLITEWCEERETDAQYGEAARAFLARAGLGVKADV